MDMANKDFTSAEYDALLTRASAMIAGVEKHAKSAAERKALPERLRTSTARKRQLAKLKAARADFVAAERALAKTSALYQAAVDAIQKDLAQDDEAVRGHYGKGADVVTDFGTRRVLPPPGRKPKAAKTG
jgi:hypothetical protein